MLAHTHLIFCHRCKHIMYFTGTSVCSVWQRDKDKTNRSGTRYFTISNQTGINMMWQGYKSAFWNCSWQYSMKKKKINGKNATIWRGKGYTLFCTCQCFPYFLMYNTCPTSLYIFNGKPGLWDSCADEQGKVVLVFLELQSQMYHESQWKSIHLAI